MPVSLTERAAEHIRRYSERRSKPCVVRFGVKPSGCSGLAYTLSLGDKAEEGDLEVSCKGVRMLIDEKSVSFIDGTELDYVREGLNEGFRFNNPNVREACGCGESFTV